MSYQMGNRQMSDTVLALMSDLLKLTARVELTEARQRAYEMHDDSCPSFEYDKLSKSGGAAMFGGLFGNMHAICDCWLSKDVPDHP